MRQPCAIGCATCSMICHCVTNSRGAAASGCWSVSRRNKSHARRMRCIATCCVTRKARRGITYCVLRSTLYSWYNRRMVRPAPRIAISAPLLAPAGSYRSAGIHTYIQHSLQHLPEADPALRLTLFTAHPPAELPSAIEVQRPRWNTDRPMRRILWEQLALPAVVRGTHADVLHATAFVAPLVRSRPTVITIYDVSFALFPQFFRGFNQAYLRAGTGWSARHTQRIIVISDCARRDIHRLYGVPLDRIVVAYPGVDQTLRRTDPDRVREFRR